MGFLFYFNLPVQLYMTAFSTSAASLCVLLMTSAVSGQYNIGKVQEKRLRSLKILRICVYVTLCLSQLGIIILRVSVHGFPTEVQYADIEKISGLAAWIITLVLLIVFWSRQGSLSLMPFTLSSLALCGIFLATDAVQALETDINEADKIAELVVHSMQFVAQLIVLLAELVMSQHVAAMLRGDVDPLLEPLTKSDAKANKHGKEGHNKDGKTILLAPSRWRMAMGAFGYVLPDSQPQRVRLVACFLLVAAERLVNLAVPVLFKQMVDQLSQADSLQKGLKMLQELIAKEAVVLNDSDLPRQAVLGAVTQLQSTGVLTQLTALVKASTHPSFWSIFYPSAFFYLACYFLRGGSGNEGLLASIRDLLWIPITQAAFRRVSLDVFGHLLDLDHSFHLKRKTGQVMRILERGTTSIQDTVSIVLFNVLPQVADIVVACVYLAVKMEPWAALIVFVTVASYVPLTVIITEQRGKIRKLMNALDNAREGRATDMLLNYETVKFFCNEKLELDGYDSSLRQYQAAEYWQMAFLAMLSIVQGSVVWAGLVSGLIVCVLGVAKGTLTIGDTVLFVTMINQLYVPLTFFGSYYRQVQKALIDMENMFELLHTTPKVQDLPSSRQLTIGRAEVRFDEVHFSYTPDHPVLKGVSFIVPGGKTLAVVGATGSGKSTILRLLLRFYDVTGGSVLIDGQDVREVTLKSLRRAIAVVPQDTVLFNDTVMHNIRYGRVEATDEEVVEAAKVAHIHDSIANKFKKGYRTKVGERGLRLSGGEKQRVAFARAVLKHPAILVLDEATSALDSITEQQIQSSLSQLRSRCTSVIVAHRLSTIMDADFILVLDRGHVAEFGSHAHLIDQGGLYSAMWSRQKDTYFDAGGLASGCVDVESALQQASEDRDAQRLSPSCLVKSFKTQGRGEIVEGPKVEGLLLMNRGLEEDDGSNGGIMLHSRGGQSGHYVGGELGFSGQQQQEEKWASEEQRPSKEVGRLSHDCPPPCASDCPAPCASDDCPAPCASDSGTSIFNSPQHPTTTSEHYQHLRYPSSILVRGSSLRPPSSPLPPGRRNERELAGNVSSSSALNSASPLRLALLSSLCGKKGQGGHHGSAVTSGNRQHQEEEEEDLLQPGSSAGMQSSVAAGSSFLCIPAAAAAAGSDSVDSSRYPSPHQVRGRLLKDLRRHQYGHSDDDDESVVLLGDTSTCLSQLDNDPSVSCYEDVEMGFGENGQDEGPVAAPDKRLG
ncbi:hypothetical protein CEUSTIGMA_g4873.t1 [Chlamydomonas eustigma]|uniref:Uncharacterized protein n=1 Tax=Chlamydomonas eustigma TaxID=1157962 RepID=A0A250X2Y2_9CHLO|nr:hypothetical protein CEUSTIGMA_g4873.t1 [Chlamydomonas eustigma]|eukprot:GAX77428.1 hypothetical protein CEUSTIGMA_g4873.t1 [Chlamydomonas eustigma]